MTPVIRALRFNERLNALNAGNLTDNEVQNLAGVLAQRTGYTRLFDRPDRLFWDEVGNVNPQILNNLSLYDANYLSETLLESTGLRYEGWDAIGELFVRHYRFSEKWEVDDITIRDDDTSETRFGVNFKGRLFHNLSLMQMISIRVNVGLGMASYSDKDDLENLFQAGLDAGHLYNITDRLLLNNGILINYERVGNIQPIAGNGDSNVSDRTDRVFRITSALTYFIENNVNISATMSYRDVKSKLGSTDLSDSRFSIHLSIRYFFLQSLN